MKRTPKQSMATRGAGAITLGVWLLLLACSASGQTAAPGTLAVGSEVVGTSDWDEWKRNCSQAVRDFGGKTVFNCAESAFRSRPFHFYAQSIVPGSGVGGGGQYAPDFNFGKFQTQLKATSVVTIRQFWMAELKLSMQRTIKQDWNTAQEALGLNFYVRNRSLPVMTFYGLGPNTNVNNSVKFSLRDTVAGGEFSTPFRGWLSLGGKLEGLWPEVGGVSGTNVVSIQQQYTEQTAPGLTTQPSMVHEQIYLRPHKRFLQRFEIDYSIGYNFYQDTNTGHFSFRRFEAILDHRFYPEKKKHGAVIAENYFNVRWRYAVSDASAGNAVPFYLQETLGGSDIDNQPTLRAFRDYRFRGPDLMMIQAEYDRRLCRDCSPCKEGIVRTICSHLGVLASYDAGKVALRKSDLDFSGMRQSFGGGIAIYAGKDVVFRVAVALGGGEGAHPYFAVANFL
jgi:hypothetical protein